MSSGITWWVGIVMLLALGLLCAVVAVVGVMGLLWYNKKRSARGFPVEPPVQPKDDGKQV